MMYPTNFKDRVLKAYPNSSEVRNLLKVANEENFAKLSHFLREHSSKTISIDFILEATSLEDLQKVAKFEKERVLLHQESLKLFYSIFYPVNNSNG